MAGSSWVEEWRVGKAEEVSILRELYCKGCKQVTMHKTIGWYEQFSRWVCLHCGRRKSAATPERLDRKRWPRNQLRMF